MDAVYRFALRLTRDPDRAQHLTQDTFLRAFQSWERYEPGIRASNWLFTICRNLFLRGEERRRREILSEVADEDPRQLSRDASVLMAVRDRHPEGAFWGNVVDDEILKAIGELPAPFREAVVLSDLEDLSYDEIAGVFRCSGGDGEEPSLSRAEDAPAAPLRVRGVRGHHSRLGRHPHQPRPGYGGMTREAAR